MQEQNLQKTQLRPISTLKSHQMASNAFQTNKADSSTEKICKETFQSERIKQTSMEVEKSQEIQDQNKIGEAILFSNTTKDCRLRFSCDFEQNQTSETWFDLSNKFTDGENEEIEGPERQRGQLDSNLGELNLQGSQIGWKRLRKFITEGDFLNNLRILDLSQNQLQDQGVLMLFMDKKNTWSSLESLNLAENLIRKDGAKVLSIYLTAPSLKKLDLSRNSIGNEGVKFIAENSSWIQLEVLILNSIEIDSRGVEFLVSNETWKYLQELYLQENPAMSDQSAVWLSCNHIPWRKLRKLMLNNSGIRELGVEFLRHSRACKEVFVSSSKSERNWRHKRLNKGSLGEVDYSGKKLSTPKYLKESNSLLKRNEIYSRGGRREEAKNAEIANNQN